MYGVVDTLKGFFSLYLDINILNFFDILILTIIFYNLFSVFKDTKVSQLIKGVIFILVAMKVSEIIGFVALTWILENTINFGVIALLVIFQPEFRRILEHLGKTKITNRKKTNLDEYTNIINGIERATFELSKTKTGALIVVGREYNLQEYYKNGTPLDALPTYELLINAFVDGTPLHDGALIIQDARIKAGNCVLPLTSQTISNSYGTRHRAGLGITEETDAIAIVVSEETGAVSICQNGRMVKHEDKITFRQNLTDLILKEDNDYILKEKGMKIWSQLKKIK